MFILKILIFDNEKRGWSLQLGAMRAFKTFYNNFSLRYFLSLIIKTKKVYLKLKSVVMFDDA